MCVAPFLERSSVRRCFAAKEHHHLPLTGLTVTTQPTNAKDASFHGRYMRTNHCKYTKNTPFAGKNANYLDCQTDVSCRVADASSHSSDGAEYANFHSPASRQIPKSHHHIWHPAMNPSVLLPSIQSMSQAREYHFLSQIRPEGQPCFSRREAYERSVCTQNN